ncbi:MAG: hypothetical protein GY835_10865 [bacterium]|nr:hypothetical protein [bacterium]
MSKYLRTLCLVVLMLMLALPACADLEDDPFWDESDFEEDLMTGTGTGGGPMMVWIPHDFKDVNSTLKIAGLLPIPDQDLYWGGAGWLGLSSSARTFVGLGGGGYGGSTESQQGFNYTRWSHGAGYFSTKGIFVLHRRLYLEAGVDLGGGRSEILVEETDGSTGTINVRVRGHKNFIMLRPVVGVDVRLAHWVGILVRGGYHFTSGDWVLEGDTAIVEALDFADDNAPFISVMVRFGI